MRQVRPAGPVEAIRKSLAKDLTAQIGQRDESLALNAAHLGVLIRQCGTRLTALVGVGDILTARILAWTGSRGRFWAAAAFANYAGARPVEVASADHGIHRLSRYGDRQLNSALHTVAVVQIRMPTSTRYAYYQRKTTKAKQPRQPNAASLMEIGWSGASWQDGCQSCWT